MAWFIFAIIGAALLTLLLSPTHRRGTLRSIFARDLPKTPSEWAPKFRTYRNGRLIGKDAWA
ncbi:hypothetical protein ACI7YT_12660 [Microbacterium sp. M]|uniref:hypothetical protein n=1 Tax=Microbacterium sp. M TaxID=3377125 RepID=UPI003870C8ED